VESFVSFFIIAFSAVFSIVNPLGAVPVFLAMTGNDSGEKRISMAWRACWVSLGVLLGCAAIGGFIFRFFGISVPAIKIAGGSLLFLIAMDMLNARLSRAKGTEEEAQEGLTKDDVAVFPLAIPLLSGPGAIVSTFILTEKAQRIEEHAALYLSIFATMALAYVVLRQAGRLVHLMGRIGMNIFSRLMGLILAAIAVQFIIDGIKQALG